MKTILIASGKGGTGKTSSCAALASCLSLLGQRVLCVDADAGLRNLDICLGLAERAGDDASGLTRGIELADLICEHPELPGLFFLNAPPDREGITDTLFEELVGAARELFDFCLIDAPAGIGRIFHSAARAADSAILVITPDASSCRDAQKALICLKEAGMSDIQVIINRVRPALIGRTKLTLDDMLDSVGARLLGVVPEDQAVIMAGNKSIPLALYPGKYAVSAYYRIARRLLGEKSPIRISRIKAKF